MVRIARHAGWTYEEMRRQPLSHIYELAADAMLENEAVKAGTGGHSSPGGARPERIIRYVMKPK